MNGEYSNTIDIKGIKVLTSDELTSAYSLLGSMFEKDNEGINNNYPILYWQNKKALD